jgi:membrane-bound lytic murein transglycosylase MltF
MVDRTAPARGRAAFAMRAPRPDRRLGLALLALVVPALLCCSESTESASAANPAAIAPATPPVESAPPPVAAPGPARDALPPELHTLHRTWTGDLDDMVERRVVRFLLVYSNMLYFLDGPDQKGVTYELTRQFEKFLNERLGTGKLGVQALIIPVSRDRLIPALVEGYGDIAAANLTITHGRLEEVDFSDPLFEDVSEIVVTGPNSPTLQGLDDLAGHKVHVRRSSSYYEHLTLLNDSLRAAGKEPVKLEVASEYLEDDDLLEMVNAGVIPILVVDDHIAGLWAQVFENITLHPHLAVNRGGRVGWAFRKNSPELRAVVNEFVKRHRRGTLMGNILHKRYLRSTDWVKNVYDAEHMERFRGLRPLFEKYAGTYDFDWLLIAAQAYQESRLDQSVRSRAGAIGVMQLLPSTASYVGIGDIEVIENNIHAGVKYLRLLRDRYFDDAELDALNRGLFAFAAYNAGPTRISRLRRRAGDLGLDPHVWFDNVEVVVAREVGREPVQYVSNIYKYYIAYRLIAEKLQLEKQAREEFSTG